MSDDRIAELLKDEAVWAEPSPELEAHILEAIERETTVVDLGAVRTRRRRVAAVAPWLAAGVAAAAAIAFAVLPLQQRDFTATLAGSELAPNARAEAELENTQSGVEIRLDITGLPRAPRGFFYQAWVKGPRGLVTIGTFHTGGEITLWSGVDVADYDTLTVTLEPEDGDPASSGRKVLAGPIER